MEALLAAWEIGWALEVVLWFQSWRTPLIETIFLLFHVTGGETFYLLMVPLVYWSIDKRMGWRLSILFLISAWTQSALKTAFGRPRPFAVSEQVQPSFPEELNGIPSGHAMGSTTWWGSFAVEIKRQWMTIFAVVFVFLTGISRLIHGVHFPQDVLAGWLFGGLFVLGYAVSADTISTWVRERSLWIEIAGATALVTAMLVIYPVLIQPASEEALAGAITPAAALFGALIGFAIEARMLQFSTTGSWQHRALRYLIGAVGLIVLRFGLGAVFEGLEPAAVLRFVRYALIGLWIALGAPWIFLKLNISQPE